MSYKVQTIADIRKSFMNGLKDLYPVEEIRSMADIIIKTFSGRDRLHELLHPASVITEEVAKKTIEVLKELKTGKPLQYVLGETTFLDCRIKLNRHTLIPRQETEQLADIIIRENKGYKGNITEIGTGSGCISIALARHLPGAYVTGTDISREALEIASENARLNSVSVKMIRADILVPGKTKANPAGILVSNPPYVRESEKTLMHRNVLEFEPHSALFVPDNDPLLFYRAILEESGNLLSEGGSIYFEINEALGEETAALAATHDFTDVAVLKDLNGKDRFIKGRKNDSK